MSQTGPNRLEQLTAHLSAPPQLTVDYLIVGSGAFGLGFADSLLSNDPTSTVLCVDRLQKPGGQWVHAYPFVRLHQPSALYGSLSLPLGSGFVEQHGRSKGMVEMATGDECLAYFDRLVREVLLPTQRFIYLPLHEFDMEGLNRALESDKVTCEADLQASQPLICSAKSLVTGNHVSLIVRRKVIDSTHEGITVPGQRPPPFPVSPNVLCVHLGQLPNLASSGKLPLVERFCILGSGKTGIDALLWLIDRGVPPSKLTWVVPREQYYYPRETLNPLVPAFQPLVAAIERTTRNAIEVAKTPREFLDALLRVGGIVKLDEAYDGPVTFFHGCSVTRSELDAMRSVKDVVRLGRVTRLTDTGMELVHGHRAMPTNTLYIDGTNATVTPNPNVSVFAGRKVTIQLVLRLHPTFSTSLIGRLESDRSLPTDAEKNAMTQQVPHCDAPWEILSMRLTSNRNVEKWMAHQPTRDWLAGCRLFGGWLRAKPRAGKEGESVARQIREIARGEDARLETLVQMAKRGEGL